MVKPDPGSFVAVNVMRARLTMLGFNLAFITLRTSQAKLFEGGVHLAGLEGLIHLSTGTALLTSVGLSLAAMTVFLLSTILDERGVCEPRLLAMGDLLMCLAIGQAVIGYFSPYLNVIAAQLDSDIEHTLLVGRIGDGIRLLGGAVWCLVTYVAPAVFLWRSPCARRTLVLMAFAYLLLLLLVGQCRVLAQMIETPELMPDFFERFLLMPLAAPLFW